MNFLYESVKALTKLKLAIVDELNIMHEALPLTYQDGILFLEYKGHHSFQFYCKPNPKGQTPFVVYSNVNQDSPANWFVLGTFNHQACLGLVEGYLFGVVDLDDIQAEICKELQAARETTQASVQILENYFTNRKVNK